MPLPSLVSPIVTQLDPYIPGEQPRMANLVKLNTNENPYPPSPKVIAAIEAVAHGQMQLYPDPQSLALRETIAKYHGLHTGQIFVGNGSDEVLAHAFFAFFQHAELPLLMPDVTYSFYRVYCRLWSINATVLPLQSDMSIDVAGLCHQATQGPCAGIVLANPNAPTGMGLPLTEIERLLTACPEHVVLVDEAYVDFGGVSAIPLIAHYPNLLVVHTLSKSRSLAGLRVGVALGQRPLIEALERVKDSFNSYPLDCLAQAGASAAYEDTDYFEQTRRAVMHSREGLALALEDLGFSVLPSQANFLFVQHPAHDGATLSAGLRQHGIIVRHFTRPERIAPYVRISVGTPAQCDALVQTLTTLLTV